MHPLARRVAARYASEAGTDRSDHSTVVEYGVQEMFKGKSPAAAAKATAKKLSGSENLFLGPGVSLIDPKKLEEALWGRMTDMVIRNLERVKEGKEDFALLMALDHFKQKEALAPKLKALVVKKIHRDPFPPTP